MARREFRSRSRLKLPSFSVSLSCGGRGGGGGAGWCGGRDQATQHEHGEEEAVKPEEASAAKAVGEDAADLV